MCLLHFLSKRKCLPQMSFSGTNSDATVSSLAKSGDLHRNTKRVKNHLRYDNLSGMKHSSSYWQTNKIQTVTSKMRCEMRRSHRGSPFVYDAEGFPIPGHYNRDGSVKACTRTSSRASSSTCTRTHCPAAVLWDACPWCRSLASARCPSWCSCRLDVRQHQGRAGCFRPTQKALRRVETRWAAGSSLELP